MERFMFGEEAPSLVSMRDGKMFVRIPIVMYVRGERQVMGMADVVCRNEDERIKFSSSEVIAEAFDVRQDADLDELSIEFW